MATRLDVIRHALRRIGVISADETATGDHEEYVGDTLDALFAELQGNSGGMTITWTLDTTPSANLLPLAYLLATEIGPHFGEPTESRAKAMGRFRASQIADDRDVRADIDDDGTVSAAETNADLRSQYY